MGDLRIRVDVMVVVVIDKAVAQRLAENEPDDGKKKKADPGDNQRPVGWDGCAGASSI